MELRKSNHRVLTGRVFDSEENKKQHSDLLKNAGFTLVELLVVIAMLTVLFLALVMTFNPLTQFNKAQDGQREHDFEQIQRALDSYFNDTHCYPSTLLFGTPWIVNGQVYMEQIPQDPDCKATPSKCYVYQADTSSSCPQWNVLYAALRGPTSPKNICVLTTRNGQTPCLPKNFTSSGYNYCVVSGNIDCNAISSSTIVSSGGGGNGGGGGGSGSGGGSTPTPTPTPPGSCPNDQYYACTGDNRCNSISPKTQCVQFGGSLNCVCDPHCNNSCQYN